MAVRSAQAACREEEGGSGVRMVMDARRMVQVREFGGEVFVRMDGVPMLPVDGLKWDLPTVLDVSREAYIKYRKEECGDGR